jgi:predicted ATPase
MAKAFKRCTQEASLVLVALDDVHNMDEMSWRVVQELFETTHNILFLCISRPLSTYRLVVDSSFWDELNEMYKQEGRFQIMTVERLHDAEVKTMLAKNLGLQEADISSTLMNDVLMQSNGMPHFANEILETMKRQSGNDTGFIEEMEGNVAFASVGELLLHRIDSFDASVRDVLNLGAVLGSSFEMKVLVAVLRQMSKEQADFKTILDKAKSSLDVAVSEGIYVVQEGGDFVEDCGDDLIGESTGLHESSSSFDNRISKPDCCRVIRLTSCLYLLS